MTSVVLYFITSHYSSQGIILKLNTIRKPNKFNLTILWDSSADDNLSIFFLIFQKHRLAFHSNVSKGDLETICMKYQSIFSGKNKKTILNCHQLKFLPSMLSIYVFSIPMHHWAVPCKKAVFWNGTVMAQTSLCISTVRSLSILSLQF